MNIKRMVFMAVLVVAVAAMAVPLVGLRAAASGSGTPGRGVGTAGKVRGGNGVGAAVGQAEQQRGVREETQVDPGQAGKISAETLKALGLARVANPQEVSERIGKKLRNKLKDSGGGGDVTAQSGQPLTLNSRSALSVALITA